MKHLKNFESYSEELNELWGSNNTGKERINSEIDTAIEEYNNNPNVFVKYDVESLKNKLLASAKENGYKGNIVIRKSSGDRNAALAGKKFIVYDRALTGLQSIGQAASGAYLKY